VVADDDGKIVESSRRAHGLRQVQGQTFEGLMPPGPTLKDAETRGGELRPGAWGNKAAP
jgi:hypothetical protein